MTTESLRSADAAAQFTAPAALDRVQSLGLIAGGVGTVLMVVGLFLSRAYFFRAYLVGWVLWTGVSLGCLAIYLLHHMTRGAWGLVVRRVLEAASRILPVLFLLSLPLFGFGMGYLYEWSHPEVVRGNEVLEHKAAYLNVPFFFIRLVLYFAIWYGFAWLLNRMSLRQDRADDPGLTRRMQLVAGPGLVGYCLCVTFAAVDWLMSLQPHWYSTIFGVYLMASQGLSALAFLIVAAVYLSRREPMAGVIQPRHFHDWGKLLFAFVMLWAYFAFSQFLISWAGNLPEEITYYLARMRGGWGLVALALVVLQFILPFALLLSRDIKRNSGLLAAVALCVLATRWLDMFWQVEPAFHERNLAMYWLYLAAPLAIGGLWVFFFVRELKKRPLLPLHDPYLPEAIAHEHH
ncbi:MAG TPA: hypothetical protein VHC97_25700 [Thermoanaerobaculia bacterium]|jgi:hypothetical protein|nr:hypothetical protein [Thermoanaerobaculia bacterium]